MKECNGIIFGRHSWKEWKNGYDEVVLKLCKRCGVMLFKGTYGFMQNVGWLQCENIKDFEKKIEDVKKQIPQDKIEKEQRKERRKGEAIEEEVKWKEHMKKVKELVN